MNATNAGAQYSTCRAPAQLCENVSNDVLCLGIEETRVITLMNSDTLIAHQLHYNIRNFLYVKKLPKKTGDCRRPPCNNFIQIRMPDIEKQI